MGRVCGGHGIGNVLDHRGCGRRIQPDMRITRRVLVRMARPCRLGVILDQLDVFGGRHDTQRAIAGVLHQ